jgi:ABC-2 type transport system ATP-binding protein
MKCEFVCALLHEPKIVFLDEPTIGLDLLSREAVRRFVREVNRDRGTTFILTTHDLSDVEELCGTITVINGGKKVYDGTLEELKSLYQNRKSITVKLWKPVEDALLKEFRVRVAEPLSLELEVDLDQKELKRELFLILDKLPVHDINIGSVRIEEVIRQIYAG